MYEPKLLIIDVDLMDERLARHPIEKKYRDGVVISWHRFTLRDALRSLRAGLEIRINLYKSYREVMVPPADERPPP